MNNPKREDQSTHPFAQSNTRDDRSAPRDNRPPCPAPQCLGASTFSSFSKCFGNCFFCIFCKPHTYSHPFLPTLVSYKIIWPIYGFVHFPVTEKRAKLGSNLKQLISENFRFPSPNYDFFLLNTSNTEDMRRKNPN